MFSKPLLGAVLNHKKYPYKAQQNGCIYSDLEVHQYVEFTLFLANRLNDKIKKIKQLSIKRLLPYKKNLEYIHWLLSNLWSNKKSATQCILFFNAFVEATWRELLVFIDFLHREEKVIYQFWLADQQWRELFCDTSLWLIDWHIFTAFANMFYAKRQMFVFIIH